MLQEAARLEMVCTWCLPCIPLLFGRVEAFVAENGLTDNLRSELRRLRAENKQLRTANEILRTASAFFAAAELDRRLG